MESVVERPASENLRHHESRRRHAGRRRRGRCARVHLRGEYAALRDPRESRAARAGPAAVRDTRRNLLGPRGRPHQGDRRGVRSARAAVPRRREARGPRRLHGPGHQDHQARAAVRGARRTPAVATDRQSSALPQARGSAPARQRGALERRGAPRADRVDDRARSGEPELAHHPRGRPHPRERRARGGDRAPVRGRRGLGRRGAAGPQGPGQGLALRRRGEGRPVKPKLPDARGHFGRFVPETLMAPLIELERAWSAAKRDRKFQRRLTELLRDYAGRPTPLYHAARLSEQCGGARIYLKREDLCHTGAHKINNVLGQALLAARMKKRRVIAETGAGQHGVATATAAALLGLECDVYMGAEDVERQALNVFRMRLLGARVISVESGSKTLKDAINEALRDWVTNVQTTYYLLGSA